MNEAQVTAAHPAMPESTRSAELSHRRHSDPRTPSWVTASTPRRSRQSSGQFIAKCKELRSTSTSSRAASSTRQFKGEPWCCPSPAWGSCGPCKTYAERMQLFDEAHGRASGAAQRKPVRRRTRPKVPQGAAHRDREGAIQGYASDGDNDLCRGREDIAELKQRRDCSKRSTRRAKRR